MTVTPCNLTARYLYQTGQPVPDPYWRHESDQLSSTAPARSASPPAAAATSPDTYPGQPR